MNQASRNPPKRKEKHYWSLRDAQAEYWTSLAKKSQETSQDSSLMKEKEFNNLHEESVESEDYENVCKPDCSNQKGKLNHTSLQGEELIRSTLLEPNAQESPSKQLTDDKNLSANCGKVNLCKARNERRLMKNITKPTSKISGKEVHASKMVEDKPEDQGNRDNRTCCNYHENNVNRESAVNKSANIDCSDYKYQEVCKPNKYLAKEMIQLPSEAAARNNHQEDYDSIHSSPRYEGSIIHSKNSFCSKRQILNKKECKPTSKSLLNQTGQEEPSKEALELQRQNKFIENLKKSLFEFENSDIRENNFQPSEYSGDSSICEMNPKIQTRRCLEKDENHSDESSVEIYEQSTKLQNLESLYTRNHKRSLSECDQSRNYPNQVNFAANKASPSEKSFSRGKYFKKVDIGKQATLPNSSFQSNTTEDCSLVDIVKSLADIESKMDKKKSNSKLSRGIRPKLKRTCRPISKFKPLAHSKSRFAQP